MTASVFGPDRICAVIAAPTAVDAIRQLRSAMGLRGRSRVLELRLDYLRDAGERAALLRWVSRHLARQQSHRASYQLAHRLSEDAARSESRQARMPAILAACRTRRGGGQFAGSVKEEIEILAQAARAGCLWCDVEIETAKRLVPAELRAALAPARVLVSAHDFRRLPPRLSALREKLFRCGGDAVKIAAACRSLADTRRLLEVVGERGDVVAIPMADKSAAGDAAAPRILALREGAALAYAAVERTTAPGQLSLDATKRVYHLNRVFASNVATNVARNVAPHASRASRANRALGPSRDTRIYGVIGDPVAHSLSPLLHNTAFAARGIDAVYLPFHVQELPRGNPRNLRDFLAAVKNFGISGFSVTLPHKESILRYLDDCDPLAADIGAVNTVVVRAGRLYGYNTDYVGVLRSIERRVPLRASRVLLLGAGGAARAAAFALAQAARSCRFVRGVRRERARWRAPSAARRSTAARCVGVLRRHRELHAGRHVSGEREPRSLETDARVGRLPAAAPRSNQRAELPRGDGHDLSPAQDGIAALAPSGAASPRFQEWRCFCCRAPHSGRFGPGRAPRAAMRRGRHARLPTKKGSPIAQATGWLITPLITRLIPRPSATIVVVTVSATAGP